ncbi:hypothetical protein QR680_010602 [Steinernema hermaphroditum]|uniref:Major facilitator superfamily (MFS) profile domain-containing protein n=1 Tax=Steinernema hermaphroditum TaxID=289476 RepID=A0AA39IQZ4_9BILA|nr:hypothetical protein QR680_010602 [Steinernema hermaphroditum]
MKKTRSNMHYPVFIISMLCMALILANTGLFHFTVICMNPENAKIQSVNGSSPFSPFQESWIFSIVAVGRLAGAPPTVAMINRFGLRVTFTLFGLLSGIATLLMPVFSESFVFQLLVRCVQGLGVTSVYVAHGAIPLAWGSPTEQGFLVSLLSWSYELAPMLSMALSGLFCTSPLGWSGVYYLFGSATILCFIAFFVVYSTSPFKKRFTLPKNSTSAQVFPTGDTQPIENKKLEVPYRSIFSCASVWGVWMTALGDGVGYQMFVMYGPTYINKALHYEIADTGLLAAFPFLISIGTKFIGGVLLDKATCINDHYRILIFTSFAQAAMAICFMVLTFLSSETATLAQTVFTLTIVFSGLHCVGCFSASQRVAKQFNHILTSAMAVENAVVAFLLPGVVALLAPNHSSSEWAHIFYGIVGVLAVSNLTFMMVTKIKPAKWTGPAAIRGQDSKMTTVSQIHC